MALTKVSSSLVSDSAVTSGKIADGGVATADIATNAVTSTKIAQNSILTKHIDDGQVTTDQLGADAVTAAKIADDAISEEHLDITVITSLTAVTAATGDLLMVADVSDSNNLKKIPVSSILAGTHTGAVNTSGTINSGALGVTGNIAVSGTVDGIDIAARDAVLTSTTTTAGAALPKAGGTMTGNITLGDNNKAIFGAGSDLQIYHDGNNSFIDETGTGNLYVKSNSIMHLMSDDIRLMNAANSETILKGVVNGAVTLYYDNASKLATTSTGIDVTGTVNDLTLAAGNIETNTSNNLSINTPNSLRINIDSNNSATDQVFVIGHNQTSVDTNNALMIVKESGKVGIGQTDPATTLHIGDGASHYVRIENAGSGDISSGYQIYRGSSVGMSLYDNPADNTTSLLCAGSLNINCGGSGADLHVNTNGKVGIGTTNPSEILHIVGGGSGPEVRLQNSSGSHYIRAYNDNWNFLANATKTAMTIKNSGIILTPNQAFFMTNRSAGDQTFANVAWVDVDWTGEPYDTGGNYTLSSGVFTAPIAGVYLFTGLIGLNTITAANYLLVRMVCSTAGDFYLNHLQRFNTSSGSAADYGYDTAISQMVSLAANETVKIQVFAGGGGDHTLMSRSNWQGRLLG